MAEPHAPEARHCAQSCWLLFEDVPSLEEICKVRLIWDPSSHLSRLPPAIRSHLSRLSGQFRSMTPYQRLASGCKLIMYAGTDCALAQSPSDIASYECIQEIRSGMHAYSMAMGSDTLYARHVTMENVYSSMNHFFTLPTREYYATDADHASDLTYVIAGKADCLRRAWSIVTSQGTRPSRTIVTACRDHLYQHLSPTTDRRLLAILREVIAPMGFDALKLTCITGDMLDDAWLKSCTWSSYLQRSVHFKDTVVMDLCNADRADVLRWMLTHSTLVNHTHFILSAISATSMHLVSSVLVDTTLDELELEYLYSGAFSNSNDDCLYYLVRRGLKLPETFNHLGRMSAVSLTARRSHSEFLEYMTHTMAYHLNPSQFEDFLSYPDVLCMSIFLATCGDQIVTDIKSRTCLPETLLNTFALSSDALENLLSYLVERLTANSPSQDMYLCILNMCSTLFVNSALSITESTRTDKFTQLTYVMSTFYSVRTRLDATFGPPSIPPTLISSDRTLSAMLSTQDEGMHLLKFMLEDTDIDLSKFSLDLSCLLLSPGMAEYIDSLNDTRAPSINYDAGDMSQALMCSFPHKILYAKSLIGKGIITQRMLESYVETNRAYNLNDFQSIIAIGVVCRLAKNPLLVEVVGSILGMPPREKWPPRIASASHGILEDVRTYL